MRVISQLIFFEKKQFKKINQQIKQFGNLIGTHCKLGDKLLLQEWKSRDDC